MACLRNLVFINFLLFISVSELIYLKLSWALLLRITIQLGTFVCLFFVYEKLYFAMSRIGDAVVFGRSLGKLD